MAKELIPPFSPLPNVYDVVAQCLMPAPFAFPRSESLWVPLDQTAPVSGALLVGRLRPGVEAKQAGQEFTVLLQRLSVESGDRAAIGGVDAVEFSQRGIKGAVRNLLNAILGATFLVLLLACANVANLFLARAVERSREMALRSALGASRTRLVVQMLTESLVVSALGSLVGIYIAHFTTQLTWNYIKPEADITGGMPFWVNFEMDGRVIAFVAIVTLITSVITGIVPALKASALDLNSTLKDGGSGGNLKLSRVTRLLVNVQMTLSVCLVVAAGLFATLLLEFNQKQLSYDPESVLTARVALNEKDYAAPAQRAEVFDGLVARLSTLPGVASAAVVGADGLRLNARQIEWEDVAYSRKSDAPAVLTDSVSPTFFDTLRLTLREGRLLQVSDTAESLPVAVVNSAFATRFASAAGVVGRRFRIQGGTTADWITVVGIVADAGSLKAGRNSDGAVFYRPVAQEPFAAGTVLLRGHSGSSGLTELLRRTIADTDPNIALNKVHTVQHIIDLERLGINLPGALLNICGLGALTLAAVGVYGVISFSVKTRTRELGVRVALGASRRDILNLVMGDGLKQISIGLGLGVLLALGMSAVLASLFSGFGKSAYDLWIYAAVIALLAGVGSSALYLPARRATRVDPLTALRAERRGSPIPSTGGGLEVL